MAAKNNLYPDSPLAASRSACHFNGGCHVISSVQLHPALAVPHVTLPPHTLDMLMATENTYCKRSVRPHSPSAASNAPCRSTSHFQLRPVLAVFKLPHIYSPFTAFTPYKRQGQGIHH
jgi:hypothetical protein